MYEVRGGGKGIRKGGVALRPKGYPTSNVAQQEGGQYSEQLNQSL